MGGRKPSKKNLFGAERQVRDFQPILTDANQDFDPILVIFSGFRPRAPLELGQTNATNVSSTLKVGGYHFLSPWDQLFLTRVGSHRRCLHADAWVPREPTQTGAGTFRGTPAGGLRAKKSWSHGLATWCPPILRVPNPFLAPVSPGSKVSRAFCAETLKL